MCLNYMSISSSSPSGLQPPEPCASVPHHTSPEDIHIEEDGECKGQKTMRTNIKQILQVNMLPYVRAALLGQVRSISRNCTKNCTIDRTTERILRTVTYLPYSSLSQLWLTGCKWHDRQQTYPRCFKVTNLLSQ